MPVLNAKILNTEIEINYQKEEIEILKKAIDSINNGIKLFYNQNGKISDSKLIAFYTIKLQAELFEKMNSDYLTKKLGNKNLDLKNDNISLNNKLFELKDKINKLENENNLLSNELDKMLFELTVITNNLKNIDE